MKKLLIVTTLFLGCMSTQINAKYFINVTNKLSQTVNVAIKTTELCSNQGGDIAANSSRQWDIGSWIGSCRADIRVTLPNGKTFFIATGNDIYIETLMSDGKYTAQYKQPDERGWHTYDVTNDTSI